MTRKPQAIFYIIALFIASINVNLQAQVGIGTNTPNASAILDLTATDKGLLVPRMTLAQKNAIPTPATGLIVFQTDGTSGTYQYNGSTWGIILSGTDAWRITGNTGTSATSNFIGTTDAVDFITKTNGTERIRVSSTGNIGIGNASPGSALDVKGTIRLSGSTSGYVGFSPAAAAGSTTYTLPIADGSNGQQLTTNGSGTLSWAAAGGGGSGWSLTGNSGTTAVTNFIGTTDNIDLTFKRNSTTSGNIGLATTSFGVSSSASTTNGAAFGTSATATGANSIALGYNAQSMMANGVAIGSGSQIQPAAGSTDNIAIGYSANVTGGSAYSYSTAIGSSAQVQNSNGLAIGKSTYVNSQYAMAIGDAAQAQGTSALVIGQNAYANGTSSIAIGSGGISNKTQASGTYSISLGYYAFSNSTDAIAIGNHAQAQGTNSLAIGSNLYNGSSNTTAIGNSSVTSVLFSGAASGVSKAFIVGNSSSNGNGAYLTTGGTWTNSSDKNLKEDIAYVDGESILKKVSQLEISRWKYKGTDEYHVGPMAQDFYKSFGLGNDDTHISTIDPSGIALISIQTLKKEIDELNDKNTSLDNKLNDQQKTINAMQLQISDLLKKIK